MVFGCPVVLFKLEGDGYGQELRRADLGANEVRRAGHYGWRFGFGFWDDKMGLGWPVGGLIYEAMDEVTDEIVHIKGVVGRDLLQRSHPTVANERVPTLTHVVTNTGGELC